MTRQTFRGDPALQTIVTAGLQRHLVEVLYRKKATATHEPLRLVEPYGLTQGKQDPLVRCYQIRPEEGWRFFMIHKLEQARDTGAAFTPRAHITLDRCILEKPQEDLGPWTPSLRAYRNVVSDALADGKLTRGEVQEAEACRTEHGLAPEQVRFVHASLYHRCLGAVLEDGVFDDAERQQIKFVHLVLRHLGWSVGD